MQPMLIEGDLVLVAPSRDVMVGDVIVYRRQEELVTHRLLEIEFAASGERILHAKGDHVLSMDAPIPDAELIGRVVSIRRGSRNQNLDTFAPARRLVG